MRTLSNQNGMALLLVLVVVTLLSALLVEFSFSTLVDLRATETFRDRARAYYLARGGIEAARMILQQDNNGFDHPSEFWGDQMENVPAGEGDVSLAITDLSGRFSINSVADNRGNPLPGYHRFIALCEEVLETDRVQAGELADALVNWFNADLSRVTADDAYYDSLEPPYHRKGGKLDTLDELNLLRGFEPDIVRQLQPFLRIDADQQINVNTAPPEVLFAWQFSAAEGNVEIVLDRLDIDALVAYRQEAPFRQLNDLSLVEGVGDRWLAAWVQGTVTVKGEVYQLQSRGRVNQGSRLATARVRKQGNKLLSLKVE